VAKFCPDTTAAQAQRRAFASQLLRLGYHQGEVIRRTRIEFQVGAQTVTKDLAALSDDWRKRSLEDITEVKSYQLCKLEEVQRVAWERFQKDERPTWLTIITKTIEIENRVHGLDSTQIVRLQVERAAKELAAEAGCTPEELMADAERIAAEHSEKVM